MISIDLSSCLVAVEGEQITCPDCDTELAVFDEDAYGIDFFRSAHVTGGVLEHTTSGGAYLACNCGGEPLRTFTPIGNRELASYQVEGPQMHLATGWRDLGGE